LLHGAKIARSDCSGKRSPDHWPGRAAESLIWIGQPTPAGVYLLSQQGAGESKRAKTMSNALRIRDDKVGCGQPEMPYDAVVLSRDSWQYDYECTRDGAVDMRERGEGNYVARLHADGRLEIGFARQASKAARSMRRARELAQRYFGGRLGLPHTINGTLASR
jgi:hypothetical protein